MEKMMLAVEDTSALKGTSGFNIWKGLRTGVNAFSRHVIGMDIFKSSYLNMPTEEALPASVGMDKAKFDAQLRLDGINPDVYYAAVAKNLGQVQDMSAEEINQGLALSEVEAADPGQKQWLWLAAGLILVLGLGGFGSRGRGRRSRARRGFRRSFRSYRRRRR